MTDALPPPLWEALRAFLRAGKTGQIVLDVTDGVIRSYKLVECGVVAVGAVGPERQCPHCGRWYSHRTRKARYCSEACKSAAYRGRLARVD